MKPIAQTAEFPGHLAFALLGEPTLVPFRFQIISLRSLSLSALWFVMASSVSFSACSIHLAQVLAECSSGFSPRVSLDL